MIKRAALAVASLGVATAVLTPGLAHAATASPGVDASVSASSAAGPGGVRPQADWGPNYNGWHVHIFNNTPQTLTYVHTVGDNVYHANHTIAPFSRDLGTRGVKSLFAGPANMHVGYRIGNGRVVGVVWIRSFPNGSVHVQCNDTDFRCVVDKAVSNEPVSITLNPR